MNHVATTQPYKDRYGKNTEPGRGTTSLPGPHYVDVRLVVQANDYTWVHNLPLRYAVLAVTSGNVLSNFPASMHRTRDFHSMQLSSL
jgi:hypothetical protein